MATVARAGGRLRPGEKHSLLVFSSTRGHDHVSRVTDSDWRMQVTWPSAALPLAGVTRSPPWPRPGSASVTRAWRGGRWSDHPGPGHVTINKLVKVLDTRASNESSRRFHNHAKRVLTSGFKNLCYPNWPSHMTFASGSQFYVYLPLVNAHL